MPLDSTAVRYGEGLSLTASSGKGVIPSFVVDAACPEELLSAACTKRGSPSAGEQAAPRSKARRDQFSRMPITSALDSLRLPGFETPGYLPRSALPALQCARNRR